MFEVYYCPYSEQVRCYFYSYIKCTWLFWNVLYSIFTLDSTTNRLAMSDDKKLMPLYILISIV